MGFSKITASTAGRSVRVLAGVALIVVGAILGGGWWALAVVGLVPLAAGALDICLFNVLPAATQRQGRSVKLTDHQEGATGTDRRTRRHSLIREAAA